MNNPVIKQFVLSEFAKGNKMVVIDRTNGYEKLCKQLNICSITDNSQIKFQDRELLVINC